jgi:hypothetical protein
MLLQQGLWFQRVFELVFPQKQQNKQNLLEKNIFWIIKNHKT